MKMLSSWMFTAAVTAALVGCATTGREVVQEQPVDHPHRHENAKVIGTGEDHFHVVNFMNRRAAKIGIQILDRFEEPYYLEEELIKAEATRQDGSKEDFHLYGEGYRSEDWDTVLPGATVYSKRVDWVKDAHEVDLRVWIPMPDGKTYELSFHCVAREAYGAAHGG